jgi:hypothetical protein
MRSLHVEGCHLLANRPIPYIFTDRDDGPGSRITDDPRRALRRRAPIDQVAAFNRNRLDGD